MMVSVSEYKGNHLGIILHNRMCKLSQGLHTVHVIFRPAYNAVDSSRKTNQSNLIFWLCEGLPCHFVLVGQYDE